MRLSALQLHCNCTATKSLHCNKKSEFESMAKARRQNLIQATANLATHLPNIAPNMT